VKSEEKENDQCSVNSFLLIYLAELK